jgi:hypothetical protein
MAPSLAGHIASEDASVEQPALAPLEDLGWSPPNLMMKRRGPEAPYPEAVWTTKVGAVWDFVLRRYG